MKPDNMVFSGINVIIWLIFVILGSLVMPLQCEPNTSIQLPHVQVFPSPSAPFVFIHIEKTGGSAIRQ